MNFENAQKIIDKAKNDSKMEKLKKPTNFHHL